MGKNKEKMLHLQIIVTVSLLFLTFFSSYLPWIIKKKFKNSSTIMSYLNCLAGGVVLGALLLHMIPHTMITCGGHNHEHHSHNHDNEEGYHFGLLAAGVSFLLLLAVDRLFLTHSHCPDLEIGKIPQTTLSGSKTVEDPDNDHGSCHSADMMGGCHMDGLSQATSKAQAFIFVLALSIHSILEGLGMSTQTSWKSLVSFVIGLVSHKWLEAFALGVSVMKANFSALQRFFLIFVYSILTPLGILVGILIQSHFHESDSGATVSKVLNGLAAGSFLFVACIEMIPPEFHRKNSHTIYKFITLIIGFGIMAGFAVLHPSH